MRALGIDLAADPAATGACVIAWEEGRGRVTHLAVGADDHELALLARGCERIGIDCPLGWPDAFVHAVAAHAGGGPWPGRDAIDPADFRRSLRLRANDEAVVVATGLTPLSVSSDRIGVTAMRCAALLDQLARQGAAVARDGAGLVAEAYPAAALRRWGLPDRRCKSGAGAAGRRPGDRGRAARRGALAAARARRAGRPRGLDPRARPGRPGGAAAG